MTITIWDLKNPYSYLEIRGVVEQIIDGPPARAHIDALSERYFGRPYDGTQIESVVAVGMASGARTAATITVRFRTAPNVGVSAVSLVDADANVLAAACRGVSSDGAPGRSITRQLLVGDRGSPCHL